MRTAARSGSRFACLSWLVLPLLLLAGAAAAQAPIPIESIFRRPAYSNVQLSPDGSKLAAVIPIGGRGNLAIVDLKRMKAHPVTNFNDADVSGYFWINNGRLLVDIADLSDASGQPTLSARVAVNADGSDLVRLPLGFSTLFRFGDENGAMLVSKRQRSRQSPDVYRLDSITGKEQLLTFENPGNVIRWVVDGKGDVRLAVRYDEKANLREVHYRSRGDGPWRKIAETPGDSNEQLDPLAFDFDGKTVLVRSNMARERMGIFRYDPEQAKLLDLVSENERFDLTGLYFDRRSKRLIAAATNEWTVWLDAEWKQVQDDINKALPNTRNGLSWGLDNTDRLVVRAYSDVQPSKYYLYEAKDRRLVELATSRSWIDPAAMTPMRTISYRARDGLPIEAQLTVPKARDKPMPLVVVIHGGPFVAGYRWGFDMEAQFFASRGYAVLMPNFRGTTGYGRAFLEAGYQQWGRAMQDDITDGVRWAIREGIADQDRVCLYGASYGGYAALMGLVREPAMFKCAIAEVAVTDLNLLLDPAWSGAMRSDGGERELLKIIGDPERDRARFEEASPVRQAAKISAPVLLAYGLEDRRVPIVHGNRMRSALDEHGKTYEWVTYAGEAHGFNKDENRFDYYRRVESFLAKYIGSPK